MLTTLRRLFAPQATANPHHGRPLTIGDVPEAAAIYTHTIRIMANWWAIELPGRYICRQCGVRGKLRHSIYRDDRVEPEHSNGCLALPIPAESAPSLEALPIPAGCQHPLIACPSARTVAEVREFDTLGTPCECVKCGETWRETPWWRRGARG